MALYGRLACPLWGRLTVALMTMARAQPSETGVFVMTDADSVCDHGAAFERANLLEKVHLQAKLPCGSVASA